MRSEPRSARTSVWALSISLAATLEIDVSFSSSGYLDVSVHRVPFIHLWIQCMIHEVFSCGFPHSDICGSSDICSSPQLFAAYHVFHRLLVPRHPPCALSCLTSISSCIALHHDMPANFLLQIPPQKRKLAFFHCFFFFRYAYLHKHNASDVSSFFFKILSIFGFQGTTCGLLILNNPVGLSGLEPPTSRLSGVRSNRLSYKPG